MEAVLFLLSLIAVITVMVVAVYVIDYKPSKRIPSVQELELNFQLEELKRQSKANADPENPFNKYQLFHPRYLYDYQRENTVIIKTGVDKTLDIMSVTSAHTSKFSGRKNVVLSIAFRHMLGDDTFYSATYKKVVSKHIPINHVRLKGRTVLSCADDIKLMMERMGYRMIKEDHQSEEVHTV
jgi:hypothetical protein